MNAALAQRQIALAGIALLAGVLAFGLSTQKGTSGPTLPKSIPAPGGGWYQAVATANGATFRRKHRDADCGYTVGPDTRQGVANPVLPCNTRIYIQFGDTETLTQVIARTSRTSQDDFELAPLLAQQLGLHGSQIIGWRYAR